MNYYKRLIRLGTLYSIGQVGEKALTFFLIPLYTLYLSPVDYGIIGLMSFCVGLLSAVVFSPIINGFNRFYYSPEYKSKKEEFLFTMTFFLIIQAFAISVVFYLLNKSLARLILGDVYLYKVIIVYSFILFFTPLSVFLMNLIRMHEKIGLFLVFSFTKLLFSTVFVVYLLVFKHLRVYALVFGVLFSLSLIHI